MAISDQTTFRLCQQFGSVDAFVSQVIASPDQWARREVQPFWRKRPGLIEIQYYDGLEASLDGVFESIEMLFTER